MPVKINFNVNEQNKVYLIWIPIFKKAQILIGDSSFRDVSVEKLPRFSGSSVCLQTLIPNSGFWCFSEITDPLAHSTFVSRLCPSLKMVRRVWVKERHSPQHKPQTLTVSPYKPCEIQAFSCLSARETVDTSQSPHQRIHHSTLMTCFWRSVNEQVVSLFEMITKYNINLLLKILFSFRFSKTKTKIYDYLWFLIVTSSKYLITDQSLFWLLPLCLCYWFVTLVHLHTQKEKHFAHMMMMIITFILKLYFYLNFISLFT